MVYNFCCRLDRFSCCFGATDTLFAAFKSGLRDGLFLLNTLDTKPERVFVRACTHYVKRMQNYNYFFNWQSLPVNFFVFYVEKFLSVAQSVAGVCPLVCRVGMFVWCRAVIPSFKVRSRSDHGPFGWTVYGRVKFGSTRRQSHPWGRVPRVAAMTKRLPPSLSLSCRCSWAADRG